MISEEWSESECLRRGLEAEGGWAYSKGSFAYGALSALAVWVLRGDAYAIDRLRSAITAGRRLLESEAEE